MATRLLSAAIVATVLLLAHALSAESKPRQGACIALAEVSSFQSGTVYAFEHGACNDDGTSAYYLLKLQRRNAVRDWTTIVQVSNGPTPAVQCVAGDVFRARVIMYATAPGATSYTERDTHTSRQTFCGAS